MIYRILNIDEINIDEISEKVSYERIERTKKFKSDTDKKRSLAVEYLLNEMILELKESATNQIPGIDVSEVNVPVKLVYDENGKPHIYRDNAEDAIHFSLSHSGNYVACIISDRPCGIDVERHSERRDYEKIARRVCTEGELNLIKCSKDFYDIWTLKESVMKAVGVGLSLDMQKIDLSPDIDGNMLTEINGIKYMGHILEIDKGYSLSYVECDE